MTATAIALVLAGCSDDGDEPPSCDDAEPALAPDEKRRAEALTSLFENDTTDLQYGYAEALDDGRGITAGRAGFTTATGDLLEVVELYAERVPDAPLAAYLPRLRALAADESDSLEGLDGLVEAWASAAQDPEFRAAQDQVVDDEYYLPAMARAAEVGLCLPLGLAILYDTIIQHGDGDDPDGLPALVERASDRAGGDPSSGVDETDWIPLFLDVRREDLEDAYDPETRAVWAESVGRCDVLSALVDDGAWWLDGPLEIDTEEYQATIE